MTLITRTIHDLYDLRELFSMEETFIITGILGVVFGVGIGALYELIVSKTAESKPHAEKDHDTDAE